MGKIPEVRGFEVLHTWSEFVRGLLYNTVLNLSKSGVYSYHYHGVRITLSPLYDLTF
jgi:hypothetical protein